MSIASVVFVGVAVFAFVQTTRLDSAQTRNAVQRSQIQEQSQTIDKLIVLNDFVDEQNKERKNFAETLRQQSNLIEGKLNELKKQNESYRKCSESDLPYSIDGMFGNSENEADSS